MSAPQRTKRQPLPPNLSQLVQEGKRRTNAAITIQTAFRGYRARKELQRLQVLQTVGLETYDKLRVYHGTHESNAQGILQRGLVPQGGEGLAPMIGDASASRGKVFFTRDKEQAAYYARTVSEMEQVHRRLAALKDKDYDADYEAQKTPLAPTIMRVLVPPSVQRDAKKDPKGGNDDYTLDRTLQPGLVLPGHLDPGADVAQRRGAVTLFQREMNKRGASATRAEAEATLTRMRSNSISRDTDALESAHAVQSTKSVLMTYKFRHGLT